MENEEKLKELYLTKSFFSVGKSLNHCFNCKYCRANDSEFYDYTTKALWDNRCNNLSLSSKGLIEGDFS